MHNDVEQLARLLRTAGDSARLKILCVIFSKKKICVSEIAAELNMSVAIVSHHLRVMSKENLLESIREGKRVCYIVPKTKFVSDLKGLICKYK